MNHLENLWKIISVPLSCFFSPPPQRTQPPQPQPGRGVVVRPPGEYRPPQSVKEELIRINPVYQGINLTPEQTKIHLENEQKKKQAEREKQASIVQSAQMKRDREISAENFGNQNNAELQQYQNWMQRQERYANDVPPMSPIKFS